MLEEVVGLNDTGSTLFLSNLWNSLDMLTLLFFVAFFILRVWGLLAWRQHYLAYDLLAVNTVFLTPRLFSALDHTRQFSQMLIAFQRMAVDLLTSLLFILIFFAGFFLALSLAFARDLYSAKEVAFKLLQLVFGFSPAAWGLLPDLNWIGKVLLLVFMVNTNYLVVTILVSVLSTTFSNVIANAHEEHQYLFALNTILAVKSDALFFFQAPLNLIEWLLAPLALVMPRPKWIRLNRYFIKFTHFPMLAAIYLFERFYLRPRAFVPQDLLLANAASSETLRLPHSVEGGRTLSGHFFGRRLRRGSDAQARSSEEVLQQVFNNTQHARRQQGYGAYTARKDPPGGKRTNDWVTRLPEEVFSPGGQQTPSDGTPEQLRKTSYFDGKRPALSKRSATAAGLTTRWTPSTTIKERPISTGSRLTSGAHSDPEDFASMLGSPKSPAAIKFAPQRRPTMDSTIDPELRAKDIDSGDDEMDEDAIAEESNAETETEIEKPTPRVESPFKQARENRSTARVPRTTDLARSAPRPIRVRQPPRRRDSGDVPTNLSSSLATQLAAHGGTGGDDELLQRMLLNRIEGIESAMKGGNSRIERMEGMISQLLQELKRSSKR